MLTGLLTRLMRETDAVVGRTHALAAFALQHGRAELLEQLPDLLAAVTDEQVRSAAASLTPHRRGVVELRPEALAGDAGKGGRAP